MDVLTFIAELVKALAWPFFIIALLLILKKPLQGLIPLLQSLKYGDLELQFGRRVDEVTAEVEAENRDQERAVQPPSDAHSRVLRLAEISPRAAVLEAWRVAEVEAIRVADHLIGPSEPSSRPRTGSDAIRMMQRKEILDSDTLNLALELRSLRNEAAHAPEFALSTEAAIKYATLAEGLSNRLKALAVGA